jgi:hypothetical protein
VTEPPSPEATDGVMLGSLASTPSGHREDDHGPVRRDQILVLDVSRPRRRTRVREIPGLRDDVGTKVHSLRESPELEDALDRVRRKMRDLGVPPLERTENAIIREIVAGYLEGFATDEEAAANLARSIAEGREG